MFRRRPEATKTDASRRVQLRGKDRPGTQELGMIRQSPDGSVSQPGHASGLFHPGNRVLQLASRVGHRLGPSLFDLGHETAHAGLRGGVRRDFAPRIRHGTRDERADGEFPTVREH